MHAFVGGPNADTTLLQAHVAGLAVNAVLAVIAVITVLAVVAVIAVLTIRDEHLHGDQRPALRANRCYYGETCY